MRTTLSPLRAGLVGLIVLAGLAAPAAGEDAGRPPSPAALRLEDLEQMAVRGNPTLAQAAANIEAAPGRAVPPGAANKPDLWQAVSEAGQEQVALENARSQYRAAWRQLAAFVGNPDLPLTPLEGNLEAGSAVPDVDITLTHLLAASPEMQLAHAE